MLDFDALWKAYPADYAPCALANGDPAFENQCAIRFGLALQDGGVNLSGFSGARCWHGHGKKHILRGEELVAWMRQKTGIFGTVEIRRDSDAATYGGLRGLMFCRNFWGPGNQGDHIDLWNRNHLKTGDSGYILRSKEVWFWNADA